MKKEEQSLQCSWTCIACKHNNPGNKSMCQASNCYSVRKGLSVYVTGDDSVKKTKQQYKNEYRPVVNTVTGKGYLAKETYARKLEKNGTHKIAGDIIQK